MEGHNDKQKKRYYAVVSVQETLNHSGGNGERDPPVLIPNTEVKPLSADGTWLDTTWESRTLPDPLRQAICLSFFLRFGDFTANSYIKVKL